MARQVPRRECRRAVRALEHADLHPRLRADLDGRLRPHPSLGGCDIQGGEHVNDGAAGAAASVPERLVYLSLLRAPRARGKWVLLRVLLHLGREQRLHNECSKPPAQSVTKLKFSL